MNDYFDTLFDLIDKKYPFYSSLWKQAKINLDSNLKSEFELDLNCLLKNKNKNLNENSIVDGYAHFCTDAMVSQAYFEKNLAYENSDYNEVLVNCYNNPEFMDTRYLPGQFVAHYIWPHHRRMLNDFIHTVLDTIKSEVKLFYEVGVGCGMYSLKTLQKIKNTRGIGFDISEYSLNFTKNIIDNANLHQRYEILLNDIIQNKPSEKADFIISQEVLEHLEDPQIFIDALYSSVKDNGFGYITAAINAGHTDHIYLYRSPDEVEEQIHKSGWKIINKKIEYANETKPINIRPTIAAFFVKK